MDARGDPRRIEVGRGGNKGKAADTAIKIGLAGRLRCDRRPHRLVVD